MTEKEKMLRHELYYAFEPGLLEDRKRCKKLCYEYNYILPYDDEEGRMAILRKLIGSIGENIRIEPPFWCDFGTYLTIGDNFFSNHDLVILDAGVVKFGDNVMLGPSCGFYASGHPFDVQRRNEGYEYAWPITVGSNVWFGGGVRVVGGVSIGDNTIIGAGSVVTKDIPAGTLAAGNPCRVVRELSAGDMKRQWNFGRG